jgi:hypothetical protein
MVVSKKVEGEVEYNDGDFAEVQTFGIEGIEKKTTEITKLESQDDPFGFGTETDKRCRLQ